MHFPNILTATKALTQLRKVHLYMWVPPPPANTPTFLSWPFWAAQKNHSHYFWDRPCMTVKSGSSTLQKRWSVKLLDYQFRCFRLPRGLSRRTRHCRNMARVWRGTCELTARCGRGTAWARHAVCELALSCFPRFWRFMWHIPSEQ